MILGIIFVLIAVALFVFPFFSGTNQSNIYRIGSSVCIILALMSNCITIVPANSVGIKYSVLSGTSEKTLNEGIGFKSPLDKIFLIDTTVQERTIKDCSTQTKDAQWLKMEINIKYQVDKNNAFKVYKNYRTLENLDYNLIGNMAQRCVETVTTKYNIIDVLGERRNEIYKEIEALMKEKLAEEGVTFKMLTIKDTDAGAAIEKSIQNEAIAKKEVETAAQKKAKAEIEAQTKLIKAQGEAEANAVKTKQLTDEILMEMWINKWDGHLPTVSGSESQMIDISSLLKK